MRANVGLAILAAACLLAPVVAGHAASPRAPFTVTNDPVHDTVVDTMLTQTCTGTIVPIWWAHLPNIRTQAVFYRKPDATKWVRFYYNGIGPADYPVTEVGVSAQWISYYPFQAQFSGLLRTHYAVWPDGDNHVSGITVTPYGTIDLICKFEPAWWGK